MIWSYLHCILGIAMYVALNLEQDPKGISVISLVLPSYCVVLLLGRLCLLPLGKPYLQTKKLSLLHCLSTSLHVSVPKMVVGFFFSFSWSFLYLPTVANQFKFGVWIEMVAFDKGLLHRTTLVPQSRFRVLISFREILPCDQIQLLPVAVSNLIKWLYCQSSYLPMQTDASVQNEKAGAGICIPALNVISHSIYLAILPCI